MTVRTWQKCVAFLTHFSVPGAEKQGENLPHFIAKP
jgi:hypothetical protein